MRFIHSQPLLGSYLPVLLPWHGLLALPVVVSPFCAQPARRDLMQLQLAEPAAFHPVSLCSIAKVAYSSSLRVVATVRLLKSAVASSSLGVLPSAGVQVAKSAA